VKAKPKLGCIGLCEGTCPKSRKEIMKEGKGDASAQISAKGGGEKNAVTGGIKSGGGGGNRVPREGRAPPKKNKGARDFWTIGVTKKLEFLTRKKRGPPPCTLHTEEKNLRDGKRGGKKGNYVTQHLIEGAQIGKSGGHFQTQEGGRAIVSGGGPSPGKKKKGESKPSKKGRNQTSEERFVFVGRKQKGKTAVFSITERKKRPLISAFGGGRGKKIGPMQRRGKTSPEKKSASPVL